MTHPHLVMQKLGPLAEDVRILFVSLDPARDIPRLLRQYAEQDTWCRERNFQINPPW
jgi:cytochrome oxidase Cu insertion factor (SCO1/SenC/PrrC family)